MIYLDHNATTPVRPEVMDAMRQASGGPYGNPSSLHWAGRAARSLLEECRERISACLKVLPEEIVFTSGGTESNRLAILGGLAAADGAGKSPLHAVVSAMDHPSTVDLYRQLKMERSLSVSWIRGGQDGRSDPREVAAAIQPRTCLVSLLHSNNETGVIQEIEPVADACRARGVPFHCDAVQSLGKIPVYPEDMGADLVTLSAHKIGGPKGVGALWIRPGMGFQVPHQGGPQEWGLRPGTENLPGVAGFARSMELMELQGPELRDRLWLAIRDQVPEAILNGHPDHRLPNTLNISFPGTPAEMLLIRLDLEGVAASSGSACASGAREPSHVLQAMGLDSGRIESALRFSLGWSTTPAEIDRAGEIISRIAGKLRGKLT